MKQRGIKISGVALKGDKLVKVHKYRDASAAIRARKSKKQKAVRRIP